MIFRARFSRRANGQDHQSEQQQRDCRPNRPHLAYGPGGVYFRLRGGYARRMAKRVTVESNGDIWTFEEGKRATFVDRKGRSQDGDFEVVEIQEGVPFLLIGTSLRGVSRFDWTPVIQWAGEYDLVEV